MSALNGSVACKQALIYFSFRSSQKLIGERSERARDNERGARKRKNEDVYVQTVYFLLPHQYPLVLVVNKSPAVYILSSALDGLSRENRESGMNSLMDL